MIAACACLLTLLAPVTGRIQEVVEQPAFRAAGAVSENAPRAEPAVRIAAPKGHANLAAYRQWAESELERLVALAQAAANPADAARSRLAAANHVLAHGLAIDLTCTVLGLSGQSPDCATGPANAMLARARELIVEQGGPESVAGDAELAAPALVMGAFLDALEAVLDQGASPDERRRRASGLSKLREHPDPAIAAAAAFWQGYIRGQEEDPAPALAILNTAASDPKPGSLPYAFFERLVRCGLVARQGAQAGALGLLLQLEDRCESWFTGEEMHQAVRTCAYMRLSVLRDWHDRLDDPAGTSESQWCADRMAELGSDIAADPALLPLSPAIPMIVGTEAAAGESPGDPEPNLDQPPAEDGGDGSHD